jgi:TonB-dependent receptor
MAIHFSRSLGNSSILAVCCIVFIGLLFLPGTGWAQNYGQIYGRVSDVDTKDYLPGANVMLKGTSIGTATDNDGEYRLANVPPGSYELVVTYVGYANQSMDAINIQKSSDNIVNVVSDEQMLRLPDLNTAEILQRLSGVSIVRDQGEGRYVQIRGTEARLTSISVNGERLTAPDAGERYVGMDVVSASQAASIEVVKALTPDMDADAIGGSVNLVTKSAFDMDRSFLNIQAGTGYSDMLGKPLWQGNFTYGTRFGSDETFGIAITGNYDYWKRKTWDVETGYDEIKNSSGVTISPIALTEMDLRDYIIQRERWNLAANLDFRPDENNQFFLRGMYNNRDDYEYRRNLVLKTDPELFTTSNITEEVEILRALKDRLERQTITAISAGGIHKMDNLKLDYTVGYTEGRTQKPDEVDPEFVMTEPVNLTFDQRNSARPKYTITSVGPQYDQHNPDNFKLNEVAWNKDDATDKDYLGGANLKYSFDIANFPSDLKVGGKLHFREKIKNQDRWIYEKDGDDLLMTQFVGDNNVSILDGDYKVGPIIDGDKFREYFKAQKDKANGLLAKGGTRDPIESDAANFAADENIFAYYAMNTVNMDNWMFLVGFRHEFTSISNKSNRVLLDPDGNYVSTTRVGSTLDYNNFLPMAHIRYKLTPMTNIRFAFTTGLARPNFFDIVPYTLVIEEDREIQEGNPTLKPTTATSLDLMGEHYFQGIGMISGGVFYKSLTNIIFTQVTRVPYAGVNFDHIQPVNGGSSTLFGIELNWNQQLTFLPGAWNGFSISANYAYTKSTADVGGRLERSELPGQAANVANFAINYEKYGFSGRLSINYNGKFTEEVGQDAEHDRIYKAHTQMDFSASQQVSKGTRGVP